MTTTTNSKRQRQPPQQQVIICPFRVVIDSREKAPFHFTGFVADAKHGRKPLIIQTVNDIALVTGDYSIDGYEQFISVERKSLTDLYGTIGGGRERFERELQRLNEMHVAAVVIEASWEDIVRNPPPRSKTSPKTIFRSINSWEQRYKNVHWHAMGSRAMAEHKTFRILERFWTEHKEG